MSENLPSPKEAVRLLRKVGCPPNVISHCIAVMRVATRLAEKIKARGVKVNVQLVRVGAILHDIGRSRTHSVHHAVIGGDLARSLGLPNSVVSIIERHVGGGISQEEAKILGWPRRVYVPQTIEEKIVAYADKLIEGSREVPLERTLNKLREELGADHPAIERIKKLEREILSLLKDERVE